MSAVQEPGPERAHGDRRRPDLPLGLIDRLAQLAAERPWRYVVIWVIGIGAANLGLRMLLNDLSLARNAPLAILTAVGFLVFAWVSSAQLARSSRGQRPRPAANPAIPKQNCAARWRTGSPGRRPGRPLPAALVVPTTREGVDQARRPTARAIHIPAAAAGPGRGRRHRHHTRPPCWCHS
jgi:hypothetical protein